MGGGLLRPAVQAQSVLRVTRRETPPPPYAFQTKESLRFPALTRERRDFLRKRRVKSRLRTPVPADGSARSFPRILGRAVRVLQRALDPAHDFGRRHIQRGGQLEQGIQRGSPLPLSSADRWVLPISARPLTTSCDRPVFSRSSRSTFPTIRGSGMAYHLFLFHDSFPVPPKTAESRGSFMARGFLHFGVFGSSGHGKGRIGVFLLSETALTRPAL